MKSLRLYSFVVLTVMVGMASIAQATPSVVKIGDTVVEPQALSFDGNRINGLSFQQEAVLSYNGWQYVTYYNAARHVCVSRRQLPTGEWEALELPDYTMLGADAHDVVSMGICPIDGTIHLAFDHHGSTLHYRVSQRGMLADPNSITWSASLFGPVRNYLEVGKNVSGVTYPRFILTPNHNMQFRYRVGSSGNGDDILVDYDGATSTWSNTRQVTSRYGLYKTSTDRNAYPNRWEYGPKGNLHVTWVWREGGGTANHDIMYAYSTDGGTTWLNGDPPSRLQIKTGESSGPPQTLLSFNIRNSTNPIGLATGDPATQLLITLYSPGVTAIPLDEYYGMMNSQAQALDAQGRIHTVMWHCTDETNAYAASLGYTATGTWGHATARRYHHYWRDDKGVWHHYQLPWISGNRPKLFIRQNGDAFLIYQAVLDPIALGYDTRIVNGHLEIAAATAAANWTDWQIIHTEPDFFVNDMLGDHYRFKEEEILSVLVQEAPADGQPKPLRILDFQLN